MAFKMKGSPMYRNFGVGDPKKNPGTTDFSYTQSPQDKAQQDLDMMKAGSRFDESGKRKKGEAKKMAKMTRKWTGLDQQKYDRESRRIGRKFDRRMRKEDRDGKVDKFFNKIGGAIGDGFNRLTGKTVGKGGQAGSGYKPDCKSGNCSSYS